MLIVNAEGRESSECFCGETDFKSKFTVEEPLLHLRTGGFCAIGIPRLFWAAQVSSFKQPVARYGDWPPANPEIRGGPVQLDNETLSLLFFFFNVYCCADLLARPVSLLRMGSLTPRRRPKLGGGCLSNEKCERTWLFI